MHQVQQITLDAIDAIDELFTLHTKDDFDAIDTLDAIDTTETTDATVARDKVDAEWLGFVLKVFCIDWFCYFSTLLVLGWWSEGY